MLQDLKSDTGGDCCRLLLVISTKKGDVTRAFVISAIKAVKKSLHTRACIGFEF